MKIIADRGRCKGHGQCELFAPRYFEIDDEALVVATRADVDPQDMADVREAAGHCPETAIVLAES